MKFIDEVNEGTKDGQLLRVMFIGRKLLLLYFPTQLRFLIGGEHVTCHWSKLSNALG